jgi:hypothetical protein
MEGRYMRIMLTPVAQSKPKKIQEPLPEPKKSKRKEPSGDGASQPAAIPNPALPPKDDTE